MKRMLHVALALVILAAPEVSFASGFKVNEQDAKAGGMGLAFTGQADDPGALATNIAGIGQLEGMQASTTTALLYVPGREFDSHISTALADQRADSQLFALPSMYLTAQIGCESPIHAGLAVYSMYGLTQDWNLTGTGAPAATQLAGFSRNVDRVDLKTVFINPVLAYEVMPERVTIAAGVIAAYGNFNAEANPVFNAGANIQELAELEQEADGWAWSWNVAVHAKVNNCLSVGAYYRHKMTLEMSGDFEADHLNPLIFGGARSFEEDEDINLPLPAVAGAGVSWKPMCRVTVNADLEYNMWSNFDDVSVDLPAPLRSANGAPVVTENQLSQHPDWDDSWAARLGVQYDLTHHICARAGYFYDETPVPGSRLEPAVPDASRHGITLGGGYKTCNLSVDFAYMFVLVGDRTVNNGVLRPQIGSQDGVYSSDPTHVFMLTMGMKF